MGGGGAQVKFYYYQKWGREAEKVLKRLGRWSYRDERQELPIVPTVKESWMNCLCDFLILDLKLKWGLA